MGFPGFPGRTWVLFPAILWGFRDFLGEPGRYFLRFCGVSVISWENLGLISCDFVGFRDFLGEPGCYFLRFCGVSGISWENLGVIFCVFVVFFRDFLGEPGCYFLRFCRFPGISWENLGDIFCDFVGLPGLELVGDGPGRAARVSSGQSGWRVARYFDPQFLNFCRRRRRPLWPAALPRFKV